MPDPLYPWMHLAGRILFSMLFIGSGMGHLMQRKAMAEQAELRGVPVPGLAVPLTGIMIILGGVMVLLGWHRFIGAGLLVIFLLPTAFLMHAFWTEDDPGARMNQMSHFMKNLGLAGGALLVAYYAGHPWPFTVTLPF